MNKLMRGLVGLWGLFFVTMAMAAWFRTGLFAGQLGLSPLGLLGNATVRADIGGLFLGIGIFSLAAAWKQSRNWLLGAMILLVAALAGRLVGAALDGTDDATLMPMVVEFLSIVTMLAARRFWPR